jgi:hypothetical protein
MMSQTIVEVRDLQKRIGEIEAVHGISFSVFEEEIFSAFAVIFPIVGWLRFKYA